MYLSLHMKYFTHSINKECDLVNQAHAGLWLVRAWFLKIALSVNVCMHVCVRPQGY